MSSRGKMLVQMARVEELPKIIASTTNADVGGVEIGNHSDEFKDSSQPNSGHNDEDLIIIETTEDVLISLGVNKSSGGEELDYEVLATEQSQSPLSHESVDIEMPDLYVPSAEELASSGSDSDTCEKENRMATPKRKVKNISKIKQKGKKRVRHEKLWLSNIRKTSRAAGESYINKQGKSISERTIKPPCSCRLKCSEKTTEAERMEIFKNYWSPEKNNDAKRQFIISSVKTEEPSFHRSKAKKQKTKSLTYTFFVNGNDIKVCKVMFLNTLSISNTVVNTAIKKRVTGGLVKIDGRGKHEPKNKTSQTVIYSVIGHISSFPAYESHYTREKCSKKFLSPELSIETMYKLYVESCKENNIELKNIAKKWVYYDNFNKEFNLAFKPPQNDTCDTCGTFVAAKKDNINIEKVEVDHDAHLHDANTRYKLKSADTSNASTNHRVLTMDLQKCLPTPLLTCGTSFYKRKLWTFDFTVYDSSDKTAHCMMWDETKAGRGGEEIASALLAWAEATIPGSRTEKITFWSDNCYGQSKNIMIICCYFWIVTKWPQIKEINHKFLLKGHTHMEADTIHAAIEKKKRLLQNTLTILTPTHWQQFVRQCSNKYIVHNMELHNFKSFKSLYNTSRSPFVNRKLDSDKQAFQISQCVQFQIRQENIGVLYYKDSFVKIDTNFKQIGLKRRTGSIPAILNPLRETPRPISEKKYKDLIDLLEFVPSECHAFYQNIETNTNVADYPEDEDD